MRMKAVVLAATVTLIAVGSVLLATGYFSKIFTHTPDYQPAPLRERVELMPETSPEWLERHIPGADGKDSEIHIEYRNGDTGLRKLRPDQTQFELTISFPDGQVRVHAVFADDGRTIVAGQQVREDMSLVWKTEALPDKTIKTSTYWFDGNTVFAVEIRDLEKKRVETQYLRKSGKLWVRQVFATSDPKKILEEELHDKDGKLVYLRTTAADGSGEVTHYRANGTARFKQIWGSNTYYGYDGYEGYGGEGGYSGGSSSQPPVLKLVQEFQGDGKTVARELSLNWEGKAVSTVTVFHKDGSKTVSTLRTDGDGTISRVEEVDKGGKTVKSTDYEISDQKRIALDASLTQSQPAPVDARAFWKAQEDKPELRGNDVP